MHVFLTLGMFNAEQDFVEFMKIWKCENEHAVMATELKVGLNMLEPKAAPNLLSLLVALRRKESELIDEENQLELQKKKMHEQKKAQRTRQAVGRIRQHLGKRYI